MRNHFRYITIEIKVMKGMHRNDLMILIFHVHPLVGAAYSVGRNYVISIEDGSVVLRKIKKWKSWHDRIKPI